MNQQFKANILLNVNPIHSSSVSKGRQKIELTSRRFAVRGSARSIKNEVLYSCTPCNRPRYMRQLYLHVGSGKKKDRPKEPRQYRLTKRPSVETSKNIPSNIYCIVWPEYGITATVFIPQVTVSFVFLQ